jgi:catechol 2,3-dioxygenase-like lactoylglutathione lyase family enzyme
MAYDKQSYVEHVAIRVKDIQWHMRFFREVLGMTLREVQGDADSPKQVWTIGGFQLISDPSFEAPEGRLGHIGVMTEDLEAALQEAEKWGVTHLPQGRNWLRLPDGLCLEVMQAHGPAVAQALAINPRV